MRALCAICDSSNQTTEICAACRADPANQDWVEPSEYEKAAEDVEVTTALASTARLEAIHGGRRKFNTPLADRIVKEAMSGTVRRRRRRRNGNGKPLRGWEDRAEPLTTAQIAAKVGCHVSYVKRVLRRQE